EMGRADERRDADSLSRNTAQFLWRWRMEAGTLGVTEPWRLFLTASALRRSGTEQTIAADFMICLGDMEMARFGTAAKEGNHPSPSCCWRQAVSRLTTRYGLVVLKSAGGSLKATWPFSPMPMKATSIGCRAMILPRRSHSFCGSFSALT